MPDNVCIGISIYSSCVYVFNIDIGFKKRGI